MEDNVILVDAHFATRAAAEAFLQSGQRVLVDGRSNATRHLLGGLEMCLFRCALFTRVAEETPSGRGWRRFKRPKQTGFEELR